MLDWWSFPGERLYALRGHAAILTGLALVWGLVPVAVALVSGTARP